MTPDQLFELDDEMYLACVRLMQREAAEIRRLADSRK
jgi:hypothetical protein